MEDPISVSYDKGYRPKVVPNLIFSPGKVLFQIFAIVKDQPSAISSVIQYVEPLVTIIRMESHRILNRKVVQVTVYAESKEPPHSRAEISRAVDSSPLVVSSIVQEGRNGLLLDTIQFPILQTTGVRAILITQDVFNGIFTAVRKKFGSGGDVIIYDEGVAYGEKQATVLFSFFGKNRIIELLPELVKLYQSVGIGKPIASKFDPNNPIGMIRLQDSLECQGQSAKTPYSQFIRGHICGLANIIYGRQMKCRETQCVAKGDEYCEFQFESI